MQFPLKAGALSRRHWLVGVAAAGLAGSGNGLPPAPEDGRAPQGVPARFAALWRAAPRVREPARVALLAAALTGDRVVAVGEHCVVALSDDGGRRWRQAAAVPTSVTLTAVGFADGGTGYAVGHGGVVLASRDGGEHWEMLTDGRRLAALMLEDAQALAQAGHPRAPGLLREARQLVADGPDKPLFDLHVVGAARVVIVGSYNLCFETRDGGRSWTPWQDRLDNPRARHLYALCTHGDTWLIAGEQGLLLRSRDGGRHFDGLPSPYVGSWFTATVTAEGRWLLAGLRGHVYGAEDDAMRWQPLQGGGSASFVDAVTLGDDSVLLVDQAGTLYRSRAGAALSALAGTPLPPPSQVLPMPGGGLLVLGLTGARLLPGPTP